MKIITSNKSSIGYINVLKNPIKNHYREADWEGFEKVNSRHMPTNRQRDH